jgi:serine/threonine protein kinase
LIRNGCIPSSTWICKDQEIQSLLGLIPKLLHSLPEEELQIGRFKLIGKIGEGGYGIVYKGYDEKLRREVAIKMPRISSEDNSESKQIAIREARIAARLDHPGILPLLDIIDMPNQTILVSPFIKGASLSIWLKTKTGLISEKVAADWALQITQAMIHAHARGVLHCDLKPGNILLEILGDDCPDEKISPKIADFGLAKIVGPSEKADEPFGTLGYAAPEVLKKEPYGPACDLWSLGCISHALLCGALPFDHETQRETARLTLQAKVTFQ